MECVICGQSDASVIVMQGMPRHIGLDKCVAALRRQLEAAQGGQGVPQEQITAGWVQSWYKELHQARAQLIPRIQELGQQLQELNASLMMVNIQMRAIDGIILNVQRGLVFTEQYAYQETEAEVDREAERFLARVGMSPAKQAVVANMDAIVAQAQGVLPPVPRGWENVHQERGPGSYEAMVAAHPAETLPPDPDPELFEGEGDTDEPSTTDTSGIEDTERRGY
jgi:hypothetical protein